MALEGVILLIGILGLAGGAHLVVRGAENIASFFRISSLFIGLTIASIGTSIPEIAVSIRGGLSTLAGTDASGLVVGNAIGSAVNQITLLLGISALVGSLYIKKRELARDGTMLLSAIIILMIMFIDLRITRFEGLLLVIFYMIYFMNLVREEKVYDKIKGRRPQMHTVLDIAAIIAGLTLVLFSSELVIRNSLILSEALEIPQYLIGIFVVGLGTGLPELAISLYAISKKAVGLSVGNLIGSNITDLMLSLGSGAAIAGFNINAHIVSFDIIALLVITIAMLLLFRTRYRLSKKEGMIMISLYVGYFALKLIGF